MGQAESVRADQAAAMRDAGIRAWRQQLIDGVFRALVIVGPVAAAAGSYYDYTRQVYTTIPLYWLAYAFLLVVTFWRRVPYAAKVVILVLIFYALAILDFLSDGRGGSGRIFLLALPFAASTFFGLRRGIVAAGVVLLTMVAMGWAYTTGLVTVAQEVDSSDPVGWISNTLVLLLVGVFIVASQNYLVPRLAGALQSTQQLAGDLEHQRRRLEEQVAERTADLTRRNLALRAAAQVARDTASIRDLDRLLQQTVRLVSDAFGYYHCGMFMVDESQRYAVLQAVSSQEGRAMLAEGHRLAVGEGVVGHAVLTGQPHIALDVGADRVFFDNPHLPETRSEAALPLRIGGGVEGRGQVIGVLDVQSRQAAAFDEEGLSVLQTLADQVAVAISNAHLLRDLEESMDAERRAYGEVTARAWQEIFRARAESGYRYDPEGLLASDEAQDAPKLTVPLELRGRVVGTLDAYKRPDGGAWGREEAELVQALSGQLGEALEIARLYEDAQHRAAHDRLVGEVTGHLRATLDVDTVLKVAAQEIRQALGLSRLTVRLAAGQNGGPEESGPEGPPVEQDGSSQDRGMSG